jgi:hypothetical protein
MEKQIVITAEQLGAALVPCTAPSARERASQPPPATPISSAPPPSMTRDLRGHWTVPLR